MLAFTAWGHDLVYDPQAVDNGEQSAEVFGAWLRGQGAPGELEAEVRANLTAALKAME